MLVSGLTSLSYTIAQELWPCSYHSKMRRNLHLLSAHNKLHVTEPTPLQQLSQVIMQRALWVAWELQVITYQCECQNDHGKSEQERQQTWLYTSTAYRVCVQWGRDGSKSVPGICTSPRCGHCYPQCPQICTWLPLWQPRHGTAVQKEPVSHDTESQQTRFVCRGHSSAGHLAGCCQLLLQTHRDGDRMPPWCGHSDVQEGVGHHAGCVLLIFVSN